MKVTPHGGTPITGKRAGVTFVNPGSTMLGRSRTAPVQPKTNAQVAPTLYVSAAAAYWLTLSPSTQALWFDPTTPTVSAYANFVAFNQLQAQWGYAMAPAPPGGILGPADSPIITIYAEPDGFNTSIGILVAGHATPPLELWCHVYVSWQQPVAPTSTTAPGSIFVGSFGPLPDNVTQWQSFTGQQTANAGQWWYPKSFDTTAEQSCGMGLCGVCYLTDQFGRGTFTLGRGPLGLGVFGIEPFQVGAGFCPTQAGPPYPWPPSH